MCPSTVLDTHLGSGRFWHKCCFCLLLHVPATAVHLWNNTPAEKPTKPIMMFAFGWFHTCLPRIPMYPHENFATQIHLRRDLGHVEPCESVPNQRSTSGSLMTSPVYAPAAATTKRVFQRTQWPGAIHIQRVTILDNNLVRMLAWIGAIGASLKIWGKIRSLDYCPESCCSCLEIVSFLGQVLQVMRFYEIIRQSVFARFLCFFPIILSFIRVLWMVWLDMIKYSNGCYDSMSYHREVQDVSSTLPHGVMSA